ncbi:MAG: hypothetical protein KAS19_01415, partial [Anaerolineales bacterium]|nr:hypothetical protein [Anaerolineales bacterium]
MKTNTWKFLSVLAVLALLITALVGCAPATEEPTEAPVVAPTKAPPEPTEVPPPPPEKVLVIAAPVQYSETFDISLMVYSDWPTEMMYDRLVSVDTNYELLPGALTEKWEVSADGK